MLKINIYKMPVMAQSRSPEKKLLFSVGNYPLSIFSKIKFEHRICLKNNLKKCNDLGHLSFSGP
jgi:hypothetical protein